MPKTIGGYSERKHGIRNAKRMWTQAELPANRQVIICPTRTPEVHELGEFSMTCYNCHVAADS